ncbi:zntD [Scenedesmus sp. PABB004]|nr:zntD [Scenedesmus sp. PABB004]
MAGAEALPGAPAAPADEGGARLAFDVVSAIVLLLTALLGAHRRAPPRAWTHAAARPPAAHLLMLLRPRLRRACPTGAYLPRFLASRGGQQAGTATSLAFHLGNMLSGGVMLSAGFCHLLADSLRQLAFIGRFPIATFLAACGYLITLLADQVVTVLTAEQGPDHHHGAGAGGGGHGYARLDTKAQPFSDGGETPPCSDRGEPPPSSGGGAGGGGGGPPAPKHAGRRGGGGGLSLLSLGLDGEANGSAGDVALCVLASGSPRAITAASTAPRGGSRPGAAAAPGGEAGSSSPPAGGGQQQQQQQQRGDQQQLGLSDVDLRGTPRLPCSQLAGGGQPWRPSDDDGAWARGAMLEGGSSGGGGCACSACRQRGCACCGALGPRRHPEGATEAAAVLLGHAPLSFATTVLLACALCIHSILEGIALGAQTTMEATKDIMLAIAAHKGLAAYALGASIVESKASAAKFWGVVSVFASATPLGIAVGYASSDLGGGAVGGAMSALASGTFLYVALNEVIPKELDAPGGHRLAKVAALLIGFGLMSLLATRARLGFSRDKTFTPTPNTRNPPMLEEAQAFAEQLRAFEHAVRDYHRRVSRSLRAQLPLLAASLPRVWAAVHDEAGPGLAEPVRPPISHGHPSMVGGAYDGAAAHAHIERFDAAVDNVLSALRRWHEGLAVARVRRGAAAGGGPCHRTRQPRGAARPAPAAHAPTPAPAPPPCSAPAPAPPAPGHQERMKSLERLRREVDGARRKHERTLGKAEARLRRAYGAGGGSSSSSSDDDDDAGAYGGRRGVVPRGKALEDYQRLALHTERQLRAVLESYEDQERLVWEQLSGLVVDGSWLESYAAAVMAGPRARGADARGRPRHAAARQGVALALGPSKAPLPAFRSGPYAAAAGGGGRAQHYGAVGDHTAVLSQMSPRALELARGAAPRGAAVLPYTPLRARRGLATPLLVGAAAPSGAAARALAAQPVPPVEMGASGVPLQQLPAELREHTIRRAPRAGCGAAARPRRSRPTPPPRRRRREVERTVAGEGVSVREAPTAAALAAAAPAGGRAGRSVSPLVQSPLSPAAHIPTPTRAEPAAAGGAARADELAGELPARRETARHAEGVAMAPRAGPASGAIDTAAAAPSSAAAGAAASRAAGAGFAPAPAGAAEARLAEASPLAEGAALGGAGGLRDERLDDVSTTATAGSGLGPSLSSEAGGAGIASGGARLGLGAEGLGGAGLGLGSEGLAPKAEAGRRADDVLDTFYTPAKPAGAAEAEALGGAAAGAELGGGGPASRGSVADAIRAELAAARPGAGPGAAGLGGGAGDFRDARDAPFAGSESGDDAYVDARSELAPGSRAGSVASAYEGGGGGKAPLQQAAVTAAPAGFTQ